MKNRNRNLRTQEWRDRAWSVNRLQRQQEEMHWVERTWVTWNTGDVDQKMSQNAEEMMNIQEARIIWGWPEFLKTLFDLRGDYWPKNIRKWDEKIKKEGHFVASHEDWEQLLWSWNGHLSIPAVIFHNGEARLYCSCYAQEPGHLNSAARY